MKTINRKMPPTLNLWVNFDQNHHFFRIQKLNESKLLLFVVVPTVCRVLKSSWVNCVQQVVSKHDLR